MKEQERLTVSDLAMCLGSEVQIHDESGKSFIGKLVSVDLQGYCSVESNLKIHNGYFQDIEIENVKPIRRPLSDMTEEEEKYIALNLKMGTWNAPDYKNHPEYAFTLNHTTPAVFKYLIQQGFDIFNWIPEGKALDKTKMNDGK